MRYYVLEVTQIGDGPRAMLVTEKESIVEAKSLFHQILASAYVNTELKYVLCEIISQEGETILREVWEFKYIPNPGLET